MDDFLAELDRNLTNIGSTKCWKRNIGDVTVWFAPITLHGQERVNELLSNSEGLGMNVINETKRITLSFSIVGINEHDLREFRDAVPRFPSSKDGKNVKVSLDKYLYQKMSGWSSQFIDDCFSVLADLLETDQKTNLKEIKFENAKDPREELKELESRVRDLRESLSMPSLVEAPRRLAEEEEPDEEIKIQAPVNKPRPVESKPVMEVEFDPFAKLMTRPDVSIPPPPVATDSAPVMMSQSSDRTIRDEKGNLVQAYVPNPSVPNEIIESPKMQTKAGGPIIDPMIPNRNPRFSPPSR